MRPSVLHTSYSCVGVRLSCFVTLPDELIKSALDVFPTEIAVLDSDGVIIYTNEAWSDFARENDMTSSADFVGVNYLEVSRQALPDDEYASVAVEGIESLLSGEDDEFSFEYPCDSPTEERWFMMRAARFTHDGEVYVLMAHLDITQRRLAERQVERKARELQELNEKLEVLNSIVRHDIRNYMNVVEISGDQLEGHVDDEVGEHLTRIMDVVGSAVDLTHTAADLVEVQKEGGEIESLDPAHVMRGEVEKAREAWDAEFRVDDLPDVRVRASRMLGSAFKNLLNNAVQHNRSEDPRVRVSMEVLDGSVVVGVEDNGAGVPEEMRERVFGRGEKGLGSEGTGVGLYLVDEIVSSSGGEVWIEDSSMGGAAFRVELPLDEQD